jgi:hypothetical protein
MEFVGTRPEEGIAFVVVVMGNCKLGEVTNFG